MAEFLNISKWICEKIINPGELHRKYSARETLKMLKTVFKADLDPEEFTGNRLAIRELESVATVRFSGAAFLRK